MRRPARRLPIVDKLNAALRDVLADPELKKRALDLGIDAEASTPAEIDARMKSDIAKWTKVIDGRAYPEAVARYRRG